MERTELEGLDRDALIARAESNGVTRARILTRPELVDELLLKTARDGRDARDVQKARGLFGRARDLLARVVERGLHLPDAADKLRGRSSPPPPPRSAAKPLPTVTLAEIYATQGHRDRAIDTLKNVLSREPDHAAARSLLERLEDASYQPPKPRTLPPEDDDAIARAEDADVEAAEAPSAANAPIVNDVDACVAIPIDPATLFLYWEVRARTLERVVDSRPGGALAIRLLIVSPTWDGPSTRVRDLEVTAPLGDSFVGGLPAGAVVRAAIGWRVGDSFVPIAHSPALDACAERPLSRWTPRGTEPVTARDRDAAPIERAVAIVKRRVAEAAQ